jgi:hypothetical protein
MSCRPVKGQPTYTEIRLAVTNETTNSTKNTKNRIRAASMAAPSNPYIPNALATNATKRKINAQRNMARLLLVERAKWSLRG